MELLQTALRNFTKSYSVHIFYDKCLLKQLTAAKNNIKETLETELNHIRGLKFVQTVKITFMKQTQENIHVKDVYFNTKPYTIIHNNDIDGSIKLSTEEIINKAAVWLSEGSGWTIDRVLNHYLNISRYEPLNGSSYIELPKELQNSKKGLINIKNNDNECFRWCHIRHLNSGGNEPNRIKKTDKAYISKLNYKNVQFPISLKDYPVIERQNNIKINVFSLENKQPFPIYISKETYKEELNVLLLTENETHHYVYIKDFNRFMFNQTKHSNKKHFCMYCMQCFSTEEVLQNHKSVCLCVNGVQSVKMPDDVILKFKNYHNQLPVPFVIYADFEAVTEKIASVSQNNEKSHTEMYQKHTDCGFAYKVVCCYDDRYTKPVEIYRGENAVNLFIEKMFEEVEYCIETKKEEFNKEMILTKEDEQNFEKSDKCSICNKKITSRQTKVRDHCHITGKYRGSAHQNCNFSFRLTNKIPVIFHNLRGYDGHFIMQEIGKFKENINVIPNNMEKYMAFMIGKNLTFIDSFQFMSSSLEKLVSNLPDDLFEYTAKVFKKCDEFKLMKHKGIYPYDYMDSFEKFNETALPSKECFYSILNDEDITQEEYAHAKEVWNTFELKTMGEYHDLYLKSDVLLLTDVFENFRKTCMQYYGLDPCHYFTSPGLSWDAMLKMTDIKLELINDIDMYQFIEKGMRGGISYIANRYSKANNKYMKMYDDKEDSKYIMYLDANNLYGWAMSQFLPVGGFKWLEKVDNLYKYTDTSKKGLILEVDLVYPKELHNLHNDYPLAPEKIKINEDMLSDYCKKIAEKYNLSVGHVSKLIPNLNDKTKYVVHYRNLKLYQELGLVLSKVHRILEFKQSSWLKEYIDFNTSKRRQAKNDFEKDFFKLMNNSVFGKTMENLRKRVDVRLVTDVGKFKKMISKPTYINSKIFNEDLVAVHKIKECLTLNRPAYIGMCILELSKLLMYDFHYNYIKDKYNDKAMLLFTDTDSLTYEIQAEDVYRDFYKDKHLFDFSDYDRESPCYDTTNKKVIGKMKDEACGVPIAEFVGLRSKMYSYLKDNDEGGKTAKGIKKYVIKKVITHENYKDVLFNIKQMYHNMKTIRSQSHQLGSYNINKVSLSCFDDKRYVSENGINTYAYGHVLIN